MEKSGVIALVLLFAGMGLAYSSDMGPDMGNATCFSNGTRCGNGQCWGNRTALGLQLRAGQQGAVGGP